ncbi:TPA: hypothetical protein U7P03_000970 [Streptococcus agalactiae]|uniref:hypothetical protein n=1 Tax=Streptococcus TaxID=1301 RepID=UPI00005C8483|nr:MULTISPECIES: hypothetical protein [Streptococcus]EAO78872.1 hypothetical protein SAI_0575 [Streptococcus agalactiae H36B]QBX15080.1 hypothetical protein Javan17_0005 [Streptococcus phage Javan17]QBX17029.1 hypothetical protein Javan31_0051 [Streptococcus phage Javan31]QBX22803.1 hypothetical protein Javan10_0053 [Streptococcus phage Javan10]QBX28661.1 hypothetical protein Javan46_0049 [Streptococcus phage Javan46]
MKKNIVDLQKRNEHFQWVADSLEGKENELYVERDWYDNPTLISKEDAKKEVEQVQQKLILLQKKSFIEYILQLLHQLFRRQ